MPADLSRILRYVGDLVEMVARVQARNEQGKPAAPVKLPKPPKLHASKHAGFPDSPLSETLRKLARMPAPLRDPANWAALGAALTVPQLVAHLEAPKDNPTGRRAVQRDALKWTALGAIPGALVFPGEPRKAMLAAMAAGMRQAYNESRELRSSGRHARTRALLEALGRKQLSSSVLQRINREHAER